MRTGKSSTWRPWTRPATEALCHRYGVGSLQHARGRDTHPLGQLPLRPAVAPAGTSSRVRTTTSFTWASVRVRGTPGRGSSDSPSSRSRRNLVRHRRTVPRSVSSRAATAVLLSTSAQASTMRARLARPCATVRRFAHPCKISRSSSNNSRAAACCRPLLQQTAAVNRRHGPNRNLKRTTTHVAKRELKTNSIAVQPQAAVLGAAGRRMGFLVNLRVRDGGEVAFPAPVQSSAQVRLAWPIPGWSTWITQFVGPRAVLPRAGGVQDSLCDRQRTSSKPTRAASVIGRAGCCEGPRVFRTRV